jgi:8-amino-7-oxononanoate synthase
MSKTSLAAKVKQDLIKRVLERKSKAAIAPDASLPNLVEVRATVSENLTRFDRHPGYEKMLVPKAASARLGIRNPFFIPHDGSAGAVTRINGREFINLSSYNYLGLAGHPAVNKASKDAIDQYGTSVSASRLVAGERPIQRRLEEALADVYEVEDCVVFVSGHATNVSTIGYLFGPKDIIIHDSLIHNSVLEGIKLAGSMRRSFPHNDMLALDAILSEIRVQYERVLIVVEGHYSMDGDIPDLPALIEIKRRHGCFLMVDEAHSLGVLGATGKGIHEHFGLNGKDVDIWMGTLSKTLAGCGGYIAGERALIEHIKYAVPGFVYSVGISPPLAAASLAALAIMRREPERVFNLRENGNHFLRVAKAIGLDTGTSQGFSIVPVITASSVRAAKISNTLFDFAINVQPIVYPAVEEKSARLRVFISALHKTLQLEYACECIQKCR